ncbi:MAG TPA: RHS repeat-associated core domain-containing protein [Candidatus Angelobacter sp.]|nr:RHS repeat-associated core domain-containing protein [Candidatus Angelobacter sp.]
MLINLGNLNVHFAIPVFSKPGRGTNFDYILSLDSSVWTPVSISGVKSWQPDANWGWRAITEAATGYITRQRATIQCPIDGTMPPRYYNTTQYYNFQYHDAFGVLHAGFTNIMGGCPGDFDPSDTTSTDSSGLTLDTSSTPKIITPWGTITAAPLDAGLGSATKTDRNGNQITTTSGSSFTDTLGMTALSVTGGPTAPPMVLTYTTTTGTQASVTVNYSPKTVQTAFGCTGVSEYGPTPSVNLVSSITLPDGSSYSFDYEPTPGVSGNVTGRINKITLRTGGTMTYTYTDGNQGIECADGSTAGLSRTTMDGTTDYSRSGSGSAWTTTILDAMPTRNKTVVNFQVAGTPANFYETHRTVYQGSTGTPPVLLQTDTCYNSAAEPNCSTTAIALPITEIKKYTILPNTQQSLTDTKITGPVPTEVDEYDFGTSPHGTLQRKTLFTYAVLGNGIGAMPQTITIQDGSGNQKAQTTFGYDETAVTSTSGVPQHAAIIGSRGNQTSVTQWVSSTSSLVSHFTYDDTGNVLTSSDTAGNQTQFSYSDKFSDGVNRSSLAYVTQITLPNTGSPSVAHTVKKQYDANAGLLTESWDLNNNPATYTYDSMLRPLQINTPDGGQTAYTYSSPANISATQKITASQTVSVSIVLDGLGRSSQQEITSDPAGVTSTDFTYDPNGLLASISNPHRSISSPTDGISQFTYDALGRITAITEPDHNSIQSTFSNNCVTTTDEAAKQRKVCVDALGRTTAAFEPDATNALNWETDTSYDTLDNAVSITQKGGSTISTDWRVRTFAFDGLSRLTQAIAPESGATNYFYTTSSGALCAGDVAQPCRETDARSITKTFTYDPLNRLTGKTYSDNTPAVSYLYDQTSFNGLTIFNSNGLRTGMSDGSGSTAWSYDVMGRVLVRQQTISGVTKSIGYTYNFDGSIASMIYPSGRVYNYGYNNAGEITSLVDSVHGINFFTGGQYAPPGLLAGGVHGAVTGWNAITLANTYNNRLQPTRFLATSPVPSTLLDLNYSYDQGSGKNNGSVVQIANGRDSTRSVQYTYDQLNRLGSARTYSAATWGDSYTYDAWGNLLQKNVIQGAAENLALTVNNKNQVTTFTYDSGGDVTSDGTVTMTYDAEGRMITAVGGAVNDTYTYDGDGRRVKKSDGTFYWVDDSFRPLSIGTSTALTKDFVFLGGQRIAFVSLSSGNPYYYLSDHLDSTAVIASGDGKAVQWEADYYPFGNQRQVFTSSVNNPYQFTGYEYDSDTGYDYAVVRFEAGRWSRFLSPDPFMGSMYSTTPQTLNRYTYTGNNPVNFTDPLGLVCSGNIGDFSDTVCNPANDGGGGGSGMFAGGGDSFSFTTWTQQPSEYVPGPYGEPGEWTYGYDVTTYVFSGFGIAGSNPGGGIAPNKAPSPSACQSVLLNMANKQLGTNFNSNNIAGSYTNGSAYNIIIQSNQLTAAQFNKIQQGRYTTSRWQYLIGVGLAGHIADETNLGFPQSAFQSSNIGGNLSVSFAFHDDHGYANNPIGALIHFFTDFLGHNSRKPC